MKYLIILVIVAGSFAMQAQEQESFLRTLATKDYGRTIIQTIQLELQQNNAVEHITTLLQQMYNDLLEESKRAETEINNRESTCTSTIASIAEQVERVRTTQADLNRQAPLKAEELADKLGQMDERIAEMKRNTGRIQNFQLNREQEHKAFEARRDDLTTMVVGLKEAKSIISQLQGGSFLQVKDTILSEIRSHSEKIANLFPGKNSFKAFAFILMELSTDSSIHADQGNVAIVLSIIDELVESIYNVQKQEMFDDDDKTKYYQLDLSRLQMENNRMLQINVHDNAISEHLTNRYADLQSNIANQQMILDNKIIETADWSETCKDERTQYDFNRRLREEQIAVIQQIMNLMGTSFDKVCAIFADIKI